MYSPQHHSHATNTLQIVDTLGSYNTGMHGSDKKLGYAATANS